MCFMFKFFVNGMVDYKINKVYTLINTLQFNKTLTKIIILLYVQLIINTHIERGIWDLRFNIFIFITKYLHKKIKKKKEKIVKIVQFPAHPLYILLDYSSLFKGVG